MSKIEAKKPYDEALHDYQSLRLPPGVPPLSWDEVIRDDQAKKLDQGASERTASMSEVSVCPCCHSQIVKFAVRKTKCPNCGRHIFIRTDPGARDKKSPISNNDIVPGFDDEKDESIKVRLRKIEDTEGCLVLYLTGYMDEENSGCFQKRIVKAIEAGFVRLIFHCSGMNMVSDVTIGNFTAILKAVKPRGGDVVLLEIQPKVYECFQLLGFSQFFNIKENLGEAVSFFAAEGEEGKGTVFPKIFKCPKCGKKLKASRSGRFHCSECKTILAVDPTGQVFLG